MFLQKYILRGIMRRGDSSNDDDTDTDTGDGNVSDSEESAVADKKSQFLGLPIYKLSYRRLPKKCLKFSFLSLNGAIFVSPFLLLAFIIINLYFQLAGITAVVISIWMLADSKLMSRLIGQRLFVTVLLLVGIFSSAVAFVGIVAFVKRRKKFLIIYIFCHSVSLCVIFICAVMSFSFFEKITKKVREDMTSSIVNYHLLDWVTEAWDNTQKYLQCCGIKSYKDWAEYRMAIPQSCCAASLEQCLNMTEEVAYKSGCLKGAVLLLKSHIHTVAVSVLFLSIGLAAGLFFAFGVRKRFKLYRSTAE
ncbi:tetraspanin-4-like [Orussus abietinus]|uniref:tetraspanin-4-like n=1 Tax=Orussus abietinus TaxID=222816 RepID=UPI000C7162E8|nr:tetraspanin-4-like [Orussus abietinus]